MLYPQLNKDLISAGRVKDTAKEEKGVRRNISIKSYWGQSCLEMAGEIQDNFKLKEI